MAEIETCSSCRGVYVRGATHACMPEFHVPLDYRTPCADYPLMTSGKARLVRYTQEPGAHWSVGVKGSSFIHLDEAIDVTHLQTNEDGDWRTWMVDDPVHWYGLKEYAERIRGPRVLVGGLGLGMILHILKDRHDITCIDVVDRNPDVIHLIAPFLPDTYTINVTGRPFNDDIGKNPLRTRLNIWNEDFWTSPWLMKGEWDTIFVDLWRGPIAQQLSDVMEKAQDVERVHRWPRTESLFFFFQSAVDAWRKSRRER